MIGKMVYVIPFTYFTYWSCSCHLNHLISEILGQRNIWFEVSAVFVYRKHITKFEKFALRPWKTRTHCCRHKCFPVCPRAQHLLRTQILVPGHKKCFWFCSETFCVRKKCLPVCAAWKHNIYFVSRAFARPRNIMSKNVSAAMSPRLPVPLRYWQTRTHCCS